MKETYVDNVKTTVSEILSIKTKKVQNVIPLNDKECIVYLSNGKGYKYNKNNNNVTEIVTPKEKFSLKDL